MTAEDDFHLEDYEMEKGFGALQKAKQPKTSKSAPKAKAKAKKSSSVHDDFDEDDIIYYQKDPKPQPLTVKYDVSSLNLHDYEKQVESCLNRLEKHEWVRTEKVSNFYQPVVELYPEIAEDYTNVVSYPMDLTTARMNLYDGVYEVPARTLNLYKQSNIIIYMFPPL